MKNANSNVAMRATARKKAVFGMLLVLLLFLIFGASSQDGAQSGSLSAFITKTANGLMEHLKIDFRFSEHFIRKAAHFTEYTLLGLLLLANLSVWRPAHVARLVAWPLFMGLLIPVLDEYSQTFVAGRAGGLQDVLLDFSGALLGIGIGALIYYIKKRRQKQGG